MSKAYIKLNKHSFFNNSVKNLKPISFTDKDFNLNQLRSEFITLYQLFLSNKEYWSKKPEIIFYINYIGDLLISYYEKDYVRSELEKLKKQKHQIELFIKMHFMESEDESYNKLHDFLFYRLKNTLYAYTETLTHIDTFRSQIDKLSTIRSRWNSSKSLALFFINLMQNSSISELIQEINILLGNQFSVGDGINFLNQSREAMTIFGIVLFGVRFLINFALILKHTFQAYKDKDLSSIKVLQQELVKRGFIVANDLVWTIISLLTNCNIFFKISAVCVPIIIGSFLVFDALLIVLNWFVEARKYTERLDELMLQLKDAQSLELVIVKRQIDLINDDWEAQKAYYMINLLGACIIALSFAVGFTVASPYVLGALALCSMLGNALYNTANDYKKFIQTKMALKRERANGLTLDDKHHQQLMITLSDEFNESFNQFCKNLAFNVGGIAFIITTAVVCWPVALCITALYVAYQITKNYQQQLHKNDSVTIEHDVYRHMMPA
ncbi:MAG: hypothetical protein WC627_06000 [Legionella sp.]|jgi:hypothetical protein